MSKEWAYGFYHSRAWLDTRRAYLESQHYVCERCRHPANMVHHKIYLTPDNIEDPEISISFDNLEALCSRCHQHEHHLEEKEVTRDGTKFDEDGMLIEIKK